MRLLQSFWVGIVCAAGMTIHADAVAEDTSGSCSGPAVTPSEPTSVVSTTDYFAGADETAAPDPQVEAAQKAWNDYRAAIFEALRSSPVPRDWALATVAHLDFGAQGDAQRSEREALLDRAVKAAPDDALVLWIALIQAHSSRTTNATSAPLQRLQQLEPDNAAVWLEELIPAQKRRDSAVVDKALQRMSVSTRFDGHFADLSQALLATFQRFPLPASLPVDGDPAKLVPYAYAASITGAVAIPAFQDLIAACRVDPGTGANAQRSGDCAATGRLMAAHGDTLITNHVGMTLLRVSHTFGDGDVALARTQDWLREQFTTKLLASAGTPDQASSVDEMIGYVTDLIQSGNEIEAMRRAVVRTGAPLTPPDEWIDKQSPYSEERLQQDQSALQHSSAQP